MQKMLTAAKNINCGGAGGKESRQKERNFEQWCLI